LIDARIVEEFAKRVPFGLTDENCLVLARVGSHSHGTYIPSSDPDSIDDVDFMGVVIPPPSYTLGVKNWEGCVIKRDELDVVFYSFGKFVRLLLKSNPNVMGMLWLRDADIFAANNLWWMFQPRRGLFASLMAYSAFAGYASAQLHKMTAFDAAVTDEWDRAVALVTAAGWNVDDITDKSAALPMPNYDAAKAGDVELNTARISIQRIYARHFQGYMGEKRKRLVKRYGYDTKNAAHLIRLLRMAIGFLQTGQMEVYRTADAQELIDIKQGNWPLERVKAHAEDLFAEAKEAKAQSRLPESPDVEAIDQLTIDVHRLAYAPSSSTQVSGPDQREKK
jgi:hypothetical protein